MTNSPKRLPTALIVGLAALAIGIGAVNASSTPADPAADPLAATDTGPVRCAFQVVPGNGSLSIEAVVRADIAVNGSYQLHVSGSGSGGSANIRQGGNFAAGPDGDVTLGRVMLGNNGGSYDARLSISANGTTIECAGRIPNVI